MPSPANHRPRFQFSLRLMLLLCVGFGLLFLYAGSYYGISRRGMREAAKLELEGFLYMPYEDAAATHDLTRHHCLAIIFAPANWVDRVLFGGSGPIDGIRWGLS